MKNHKYAAPIKKQPLSDLQKSMLNLSKYMGNSVSLRQAAKDFYELRYPTGIQNHICTQMRKTAACNKSITNEATNLKLDYFLHCIGSTDYRVEAWDCKLVRKQITKWDGSSTFIPTGEYEEYYSLYLKGYWLNEISKKPSIPKWKWHNRNNPLVKHAGLHPKWLTEDGDQMSVEQRKAKYVDWIGTDDWPNPKLKQKYNVEPSGSNIHPFKVVYNGNPFLYELESNALEFCKKLESK